MIRNLTLATGLLALSALAFAPNVVAAPATMIMPFNGEINGVCTFSNTAAGVLANTVGQSWVEGSAGSFPGLNGGEAGTTTLNCTSGGTLSTAVPVKIAAPASFVPAKLQSLVYNITTEGATQANNNGPFDTGAWSQSTTALTIPANRDNNLGVAMVAGTNNLDTIGFVPSGTYIYNVTLTATPN